MIKFDLYHGTSYQNYKKIKQAGKFIYKPRIDHWLGNGIYFFINDRSSAEWWANTNFPHKDKCIIYFGLEIDRKCLLDLNSQEDYDKLQNFRNALNQNGITLSLNEDEHDYLKGKRNKKETENHILLSKLIKMYVLHDKNIKAVCYAFNWQYRDKSSVNDLLGRPRQNQINILDKYQSLINIDEIKCDKV